MGKKSVKENKNAFQLAREEADLTRAAASELMVFVSESRIENIEYDKIDPQPEDVLAMVQAYKSPRLSNHYCSKVCPIGKEFVPEIQLKDLSQIVLELLASLNSTAQAKERLIEISVDGEISEDELTDFAQIQNDLSKISLTVDTLQLWVKNTIAAGKVDNEKLEAIRKQLEA